MAQTIEWSRAFGGPFSGETSVAFDPFGDILVSGERGVRTGGDDILVIKYDSTGQRQWTQNLGYAVIHDSSVATDADANVFVSNGFGAVSLFKFNPNGDQIWTTTPPDSAYNGGIAVDGQQNLYFGGSTEQTIERPLDTDVFISKFDNSGSLLWRRELATKFTDWCTGVSADANGNVYVAGYTRGDLEGDKGGGDEDIFVSKFNGAGDLQWTRQFGLFSDDRSGGISVDGVGNVFVSGYTPDSLGSPNLGGHDAVLMKLDALGNLQWLRQFGTTDGDLLFGVAADGHGNAFVTGDTNGSLGGPSDAFVAKFNSDGETNWTLQLGGEGHQSGYGIATDGRGSIAVGVGSFVTKIRDVAVPEPGALGLSLGFLGLFWNRRRSPRRVALGPTSSPIPKTDTRCPRMP